MVVFLFYFMTTAFHVLTTVFFDIEYSESSLYFLCESSGVMPGKVCDQSIPYASNITYNLLFLMYGLYPVVCLLYAVDLKKLKESTCISGKRHATGQSKTSTNSFELSTQSSILSHT